MSDFINKLRRDSAEQMEASAELWAADDLDVDVRKQLKLVIAQVNARMLSTIADLADYLAPTSQSDIKLREMMERNNELRRAAANRDWEEFDRLVSERVKEEIASGAT